MPALQRDVMRKLYKQDVWENFSPSYTTGKVQGWNGDHPSLVRLAGMETSRIIIDVGVWKGQSTITLASGLRDKGLDGCVIAVDTFLGSPEHWGADGIYFSRQHGRPDLFQTFMSNVFNAGLSDYVVPIAQTSKAAAAVIQGSGILASVIHVDAAHEYSEVLQDVEAFWELLTPDGFMIGDDYHETWPGVIRAAGEFSSRKLCPLSIEGAKWILRKRP